MKKFKALILILFTIITIILFFIPEKKSNTDIKALDGVLNLSEWNFNRNGEIKLQGKWDMFYGELLTPNDINMRTASSYYNIPGRLSNQINGKKQGYMTLHLRINVPRDEVYGIFFESLFTSSDIWINGIHYGGHGKVGTSISNEEAIYRPQYIYFTSVNKKVDILIHTSTYRDLAPALRPAVFGTKQQIVILNYKNVSLDGFTIGIMFIMGIFCFGLYFTKPKQNRYIYFSGICFLMILRCLVFNSRLLVEFYPNMPYEVLSKIAAITFYLFITLYTLFLDDIFNNKIKIKNASIIFGLGLTALCIFTNSTIYDRTAIFAEAVVAFFVLYLSILFIREVHNKNLNAEKNLFPFIIVCLSGFNDILVNNSVIHKHYIILYGIIVFIAAQSLFIIRDYLEKNRKLDSLNRDGLTYLYNNIYIKKILSTHLNRFIQKKEIFSVLMIDIDDFKGINDSFGHMFGDTVIVDIANMLNTITNDKGYIGRFGGDEFIIILPKIAEKDAVIFAKEIMKRIEVLNEKYNIDKMISLSIGVYENDVNDLVQCIDNVDTSMYKAKALGKDCISAMHS